MFPVDGFSYIKCKKQKTENEISDKCLVCLFCLLVCWFSVVFFVCSGLSVSGKDKLNWACLLRKTPFLPWSKAVECSYPGSPYVCFGNTVWELMTFLSVIKLFHHLSNFHFKCFPSKIWAYLVGICDVFCISLYLLFCTLWFIGELWRKRAMY